MITRDDAIELKLQYAAKAAARLRRLRAMPGVPAAIVDHERAVLEARLVELDLLRAMDDRVFLVRGGGWAS